MSRDTDYGIHHGKESILNDWLIQEFKERVSRKRSIYLTKSLSEAFKRASITVSEEEEKAEETLLEERDRLSKPTDLNLHWHYDPAGLQAMVERIQKSYDPTALQAMVERIQESYDPAALQAMVKRIQKSYDTVALQATLEKLATNLPSKLTKPSTTTEKSHNKLPPKRDIPRPSD
ncbi:hypothetical protein ACFLWW_03940 [Chloroflexota bacterium]